MDQNQSTKVHKVRLALDDATTLAVMRTRLAAERTLMSWIRTAFSMIGFGFGLLKFFEYLFQANPNTPRISGSWHLGIFLILLGTFCLIPGIIEHTKSLRQLHAMNKTSQRWSYALIVAILVGGMGIYVLGSAVAVRFFE